MGQQRITAQGRAKQHMGGGEKERLYHALRKTWSQELRLLPEISSSTASCGCTDTEHFCGDLSGLKVRVPS